jgi:hypothetical protein
MTIILCHNSFDICYNFAHLSCLAVRQVDYTAMYQLLPNVELSFIECLVFFDETGSQ